MRRSCLLKSLVWGCLLGGIACQPLAAPPQLADVRASSTDRCAGPGTGALPVIPGAAGFGMATPAGRHGVIYKVTTLSDHPGRRGTLRACLEARGPRVCIFEVGGSIEPARIDRQGWVVSDRDPDGVRREFRIVHPCITIAGQTAPPPGVSLVRAGLSIETHDVLLQHIAIRVGGELADTGQRLTTTRDGLGIRSLPAAGHPEVFNVVVDHVSVSWAVDENVELYDGVIAADRSPSRDHPRADFFPTETVHDVTIRNSIISGGLHASTHKKGPHSMGILVGEGIARFSLIGSLLAHNAARNPQIGGSTKTALVNNVIFRSGSMATNFKLGPNGPAHASVVGNVFIDSVSPMRGAYPLPINFDSHVRPPSGFYVHDNTWRDRHGVLHEPRDPWDLVNNKAVRKRLPGATPEIEIRVIAPLVWPDALEALPSSETERWVFGQAGSRPAERDSIDARTLREVRARRCVRPGGERRCIIDSQDDVGGFPSASQVRRELHPPQDPSAQAEGGYTALEVWLHAFARRVETAR